MREKKSSFYKPNLESGRKTGVQFIFENIKFASLTRETIKGLLHKYMCGHCAMENIKFGFLDQKNSRKVLLHKSL